MPCVAYLANEFPSPVEWYVVEEIRELRRRGVLVIPCSARAVDRSKLSLDLRELAHETLTLEPIQWRTAARAICLCVSKFCLIAGPVTAALLDGSQSLVRRLKTLLHTLLGAYYAVLLRDLGVEHIHVHHGYFSSWIALIAARFLDIPYSMTLHGSDLLIHAVHMNTKLRECKFCLTVSEFNRRHILAHYPAVSPGTITVRRLGVWMPGEVGTATSTSSGRPPVLLAVGRLHSVKNHAFLLRACSQLRDRGVQFRCVIVGEGPERHRLELLINELDLSDIVSLAGQIEHHHMNRYYQLADLVVLTSHSEGIPLVLMEAMAYGKTVLAPAITGIPELVLDGKTGFLYSPNSLPDFVAQVEQTLQLRDCVRPLQNAAREHVRRHFEQRRNLEDFADLFLEKVSQEPQVYSDENSVLQQI